MPERQVENLQILRAFAALNVVVFHAIGSSNNYGFEAVVFPVLGQWGTSGVDVFFVLSGFIMVYTQLGRKRSPLSFILGRIYRIVPLYWLLTIFYVLLLLLFPSLFREAEFDWGRTLASLFFVNNIAFETHPIVGVGWTLEYEMLFYLIFAAALILSSNRMVLPFSMSALLILHFIFGVDPIIFEFGMGMLAAALVKSRDFPKPFYWLSFIVGCLLLAANIVYAPPFQRWVAFGLPSLLLVFGAYGVPELKWRLGRICGDASYSIYLIQIFTLPLIFKLASYAPLPADLLILVSVLFTCGIGIFLHKGIEVPISRQLRYVRRIGSYQSAQETA